MAIRAIGFALLALVVPLSGRLLAGTTDEHRPWARVLPAMCKVRAGDRLPAGSASVQLSAARGECEGAQVVAPGPVEAVVASVSPLRAAGGEPLEAVLYRAEYLEAAEASNFEGRPGRWADPLVPVRDAYLGEPRRAFPASSADETPVVVYLELCVPAQALAGLYRGELSLQATGRPKLAIPIELQVRSFTLPATSSLPNTFGFSGLTAARGHGLEVSEQPVRELTRLYSLAALRHRVSLHGMTMEPPPMRGGDPGRLDFAAWDEEVGPFLDGTALESGARFTSIDVRLHPKARSDEERAAYLRAFTAHLRERGWLDRAFLYAKDEPRPEDLPLVRRGADLVHKAAPGLRVLVTTPLSPLVEGAVDLLTPNLNCLFARPGDEYCRGAPGLERYAQVRRAGTRLWWYQSCGSHGCGPVPPLDLRARAYFSGWPSYMVDHDAALNRAMGMLAFLHGIDGELYFNTVEAYVPGPDGAPADPWKSLWRFHGNGDGTLFYPGTPARIGGTGHVPVESLRLKHLRDGLEDYEYLALARRVGLTREADGFARSLAPEPYRIAREPERWRQARERLARALERANSPRE